MKQGTDAALAMAFGHVILNEFHVKKRRRRISSTTARKYTDFPFLVRLKKKATGNWVPERFLRASDFDGKLGEANNPDWKTVAIDETTGDVVMPQGSIGFRWGEQGKWNLEEKVVRRARRRSWR